MILPQAPSWFRRHLRVIDPTLGVRFNPDSQMWEVTQMVPKVVDHGNWRGGRLRELKRVPQRIMSVPVLGSRVFGDIRSLWGPKVHDDYEGFCKEHNIRVK